MTTVRSDRGSREGLSAPLLEVVAGLAAELRPELPPESVHLDAALDKDLALDSLARVELVLRLEEQFDVALPEQEIALAETPRDLLRIVENSLDRPPAERAAEEAAPLLEAGERAAAVETPRQAESLIEVLDWHAERHPDRTHILLYDDGEEATEISYGDLLQRSEEVASGLRERGIGAGQTVAIMLPTGADYFYTFYGILLAGGIPVPLYPPVRPSQLEDHLRRQALILRNCEATAMVTVPEAKSLARLLRAQVPSLRGLWTADDLRGGGPSLLRPRLRGEDVAFLQYTSGSTGQPKGVVLTHANLLVNLRAMADSLNVTSTDLFVSWLPLYHDMGLIGAGMGSLLYAFPLVLISPLSFMSRPQRWLRLIDRHRATLSAGPNFAYELCLNKVPDSELEGLDLSSWRLALNGAEPVSPTTLERFRRRFAHYGFRPEVLTAVYGLAESSLGVSFPPPGRMPVLDRVDRQTLLRRGIATPADREGDEEEGVLTYVGCGFPLPGHQIRIADDRGSELPERQEGHIQFRGPSCTSGYYRNPGATAKLMVGDWLDSGDLGYMAGGELFITGRVKDIVIRAGRNLSPYELEVAVSAVDGVRKGCVAVFGAADHGSGTERLVVLAETRETAEEDLLRMRQEISAAITEASGTPPDEVVLAPPGSVLKTSSGKIRRSACRELFETGKLGAGRPAVWRQLASLVLASLGPQARRSARAAGTVLYTLWAWLAFALVVVPGSVTILLLPSARGRRLLVRRAARALLAMIGVRVDVESAPSFPPEGAYVVVSNHASYLDAILLPAVLPADVWLVAKAELAHFRLLRLLLHRIGIEFVERWNRERGLEDSRRLGKRLADGEPILFFPEGTFTRIPGLLPFRMGAFSAAAEASVPIVPMVLRGTRSVLRAGEWRLRRGPVSACFLAPIEPESAIDDCWQRAVRLRDQSRRAMLEQLGEPDLVAEREEGLERLRRERVATERRDGA